MWHEFVVDRGDLGGVIVRLFAARHSRRPELPPRPLAQAGGLRRAHTSEKSLDLITTSQPVNRRLEAHGLHSLLRALYPILRVCSFAARYLVSARDKVQRLSMLAFRTLARGHQPCTSSTPTTVPVLAAWHFVRVAEAACLGRRALRSAPTHERWLAMIMASETAHVESIRDDGGDPAFLKGALRIHVAVPYLLIGWSSTLCCQ